MSTPATQQKRAAPLFVWLASFVLSVFAVDAQAAIDNADILDNVLQRYHSAASAWASIITTAATWLFWTLALISMVWTFGLMALRKADLAEFFAEFFKFTVFVGFFYWLLINGPAFASSIIDSLKTLAGNATGLGSGLAPSSIVDIGFEIFFKVLDQSSVWSPVDSAVGVLIAIAILIILTLIAVNMLLLLASGWILAYGGIFFLGFGGSRWTSDMAINYFKTVLGIAAQLFAMVLLIGIGKTFLDDYYSAMSSGVSLKEMGVMLIVALVLLALVSKVPPVIAGIITGASVGGGGGMGGGFGMGSLVAAAGMAATAGAAGMAAASAGAAQAGGGAQALMAAVNAAQGNVAAGTDVLSKLGGDGGGSGGDSKDSGGGGSTPFAEAAGFADTPAQDGSGGEGADTGAGDTGTGGGEVSAGGASGGAGSDSDGGQEGGAGGSEGGSGGGAGAGAPADGSGETAAGAAAAGGAAGAGQDDTAPADSGQKPAGAAGGHRSKLAGAAGKAGRIAADTAAVLARGTADVAKEKIAAVAAGAMGRVSQTAGGQVAAAIKARAARGGAPSFSGNSLAGVPDDPTTEADPTSEVAAFRDKGKES